MGVEVYQLGYDGFSLSWPSAGWHAFMSARRGRVRTKVFVAGLVYEAKEEDLRQLAEKQGCTVISAMIITDKATGKSRGFGFVVVETGEEAVRLIEMLNGTKVNGRALTVELAKPRQQSGGRGERRRE